MSVDGAGRHVAAYRFRVTFRARWREMLGAALILGVIGGLSMAAVAAARRTQASFPRFLASTNPADALGVLSYYSPPNSKGYDPAKVAAIEATPHVSRVAVFLGFNAAPIDANGVPIGLATEATGASVLDPRDEDVNRSVVVAGRYFDNSRPDEVMVTSELAKLSGYHVGQSIRLGVFTNEQTTEQGFGTSAVPPHATVTATIVGIVLANNAIVEDDVDAGSQTTMYFTPALVKPLIDCCVYYSAVAVKVDQPGNVASVLAGLHQAQSDLPPLTPANATLVSQAERAIRPESIALAVFGGIAALACLLIMIQIFGRQRRARERDAASMWALGATRATMTADALLSMIAAIVVGAVLAACLAVLMSPLAPVGPVRRFVAHGITIDWPVIGVGTAVVVVVLAAAALVVAYRVGPTRIVRHSGHAASSRAGVADVAARSGLPTSAQVGIRFATYGGSTAAAPVRSAMFGAVLATIVLVGSVTFGNDLRTLVNHPSLYGWNWDEELTAGQGGGGDIPQPQADQLLRADPDVSAWSGYYFTDLYLDGQAVPVIATGPNADVAPPVLSGHAVSADDEIVLGALTLQQLHKHVGDTVLEEDRIGPSHQLRIVGTSTLPAIGTAGSPHLEMGVGAVVSQQLVADQAKNPYRNPITGPHAIFVRFRSGVDHDVALARLQQIATTTSNSANSGVTVDDVQRPAEIVNYRSMGATPALLGAGLAAGSIVALALTLITSVRRRRRELATLKALGFTGRQSASAIAWQSSVAVGVGLAIGIPTGIVIGRELWTLFAHQIHTVVDAVIPAGTILLVAAGGLVLANIVAALPGRQAARIPAALALRSE